MKWILAESDRDTAEQLAAQAGIHPLVAQLLVNRGITDTASAFSFLSSGLSDISDPGIFRDMDRAVQRIKKSVSSGEKIVIYGDYDVDGITGSALLFLLLKDMGAHAVCYIPDRMTEGYGLNESALQTIRSDGAGLLITVDCGITAVREVEFARSIGLEVIITDHHESAALEDHLTSTRQRPPGLPDAHAIIHPLFTVRDTQEQSRKAVEVLTGVGVVFKLSQALVGQPVTDQRLTQYLDLVTLGTVADMGQLSGENRLLVKSGLRILSSPTASRPGIETLKRVAGLAGREITVGSVGFALAPRINASGRLEHADTAFRLLTTSSPEEAEELAEALDTVNRERKAVEEDIWEEARRLCRRLDLNETGAIVLASDEWHPGVVGIVASRIAEEFYRPTALIALQDGRGKGSARSIPGFDLYDAIAACSDLLLGFGGHRYAAGVSVAEEKITQFRDRLSRITRERVGKEGFVRTLTVDRAMELNELNVDLMKEIERLAPFGQGNPEPRIGARGLEVVSSRIVGNNHLKLRLRQDGGIPFDSIAFNRGGQRGWRVRDGSRMAAVFTPRFNTWNGTTSIELNIRDIKREQ